MSGFSGAGGGGGAAASGLPTGYIHGLGLRYVDGRTVTVLAGECRDSSDSEDLAIADDATLSLDANGSGGQDRKALTGTGALSGGALTGTGTAFLTEFGTRALTGTLSNTGTAVTGVGTLFATEVAVGDLIGNASLGFTRVTSITDDTHLTLSSDIGGFLGGSASGATVSLIEGGTVQAGSVRTTITGIESNTTLYVDDSSSSVGAGAALYTGVVATTPNTAKVQIHYAVWVIGSGVYVSTQRTTPYTAGSSRRIGRVFFLNINSGEIVPFGQIGSGSTRRYAINWSDAAPFSYSGLTEGAATLLHLSAVPPGVRWVHLGLQLWGPSTSLGLYVKDATVPEALASVSNSTNFVYAARSGDYVRTNVDIGCDSLQRIYYHAGADANNSHQIYVLGYTDELE